jgi:hypothetical protein
MLSMGQNKLEVIYKETDGLSESEAQKRMDAVFEILFREAENTNKHGTKKEH